MRDVVTAKHSKTTNRNHQSMERRISQSWWCPQSLAKLKSRTLWKPASAKKLLTILSPLPLKGNTALRHCLFSERHRSNFALKTISKLPRKCYQLWWKVQLHAGLDFRHFCRNNLPFIAQLLYTSKQWSRLSPTSIFPHFFPKQPCPFYTSYDYITHPPLDP